MSAVEKRQELHEKQKFLSEVLELAQDGDVVDFSRKTVLEKLSVPDADSAFARVKSLNVELDDIGAKLRQSEVDEIRKSLGQRETELKAPVRGGGIPHPTGDDGPKTLGEMFVAHKDWKTSRENRTPVPIEFDMGLKAYFANPSLDVGLKTLFTTTAGFAPESIRTGRLVEGATRPIQVIDLIPMGQISQAVEKYMEETTRTHAAAEKAEGIAYAESTFVWTEKTSDVRKITDSLPLTDEVLEDDDQVRGIIDQRLRFGVIQRLDGQVLVGDGTAPNLRGINNVVGIQTQAKGTEMTIVAFLRALTKVRFTGRANPSGAVFHPNDWLDILLTQDNEGRFLFGNPFMGPGPQSLFGIPVAQSDAQTENTGLIGDFVNFSRISERRGIVVLVGFVGTQFTEGKSTIRADIRAAFTVYRPAAFVQLTGI